MIDHQSLVRSAQDIEPLPASVSRLLALAAGDRWNLQEVEPGGIIHHHTPDQAGDIIADATHVANIAAKRAGTGFSANADDLQLNDGLLARLGLAADGFETLCDRVHARLDTVLTAYA